MIETIYTGLVNTLNAALSKATYRISTIKKDSTDTVECAIKVMLGKMEDAGIGQTSAYNHYGWIYFDFGSNDRRAHEKVVQAIDELLDWMTSNYTVGAGFDIGGGNYIREMKHIPFQGYPQPKELFFQDMILVSFKWERR